MLPALFRRSYLACAFACALAFQSCAPKPAAAPLVAQPTAAVAVVALPVRALPTLGEQTDPHAVAVGVHGAVASAEPQASSAALAVLQAGGNAVDAAIALAFALAVTHPSAGNLGGGGFMLLRLKDGRTTAIDYREMAPAAATRNIYLDKNGNVIEGEGGSIEGYRAAGVPGTARGMELALKR